jgi:glycosyltransferase involved in cell wall biosynthesis
MTPSELVSVVVPSYQEAATIEEIVRRVDAVDLSTEILVVDDGSTDGTAGIVERLAAELDGVRLLRHAANRGKGAAVRTGVAASRGGIVVIQDADLEYDPADLPRLVELLQRGVADVVYGTRLRGGQPQRAHLFWHLVGNRFLSLLTNVLFNTTLSDMEVGYKAFRGDLIRSIPLVSDDFRFEPEVTARVLRRRVRLYELPISYYGRTFAEGKKITWRDGFRAIAALVRFRIDRRDSGPVEASSSFAPASGAGADGRIRAQPLGPVAPDTTEEAAEPSGTSAAPGAAPEPR